MPIPLRSASTRTLPLLVIVITGCSVNFSETLDHIGAESHPYWECQTLEFSPDGLTVAAVCAKKRQLKLMVFDVTTGVKQREADFSEADSENYRDTFHGYLANIEFSSDGNLIAIAGTEMLKRATVWDIDSLTRWELPKIVATEDYPETAIAFSPNDRHIAIGNTRGRIGIFDVATRSRVSLIDIPDSSFPITTLAFSPTGEYVVAAIRSQKIPAVRAWNWNTGNVVATINHGSLVMDIIFNRDTSRLYTLAAGNEIRVWEIISESEVADGGVDQTSAERSLPVLLSVLCGASVAVNFNPVTFTSCVGGLSSMGSIRGNSAVPRLAISPDGERIVIVDNRATKGFGPDRIVMFDALTLEELWTTTAARSPFDSLFSWAHDVAYSPDGKTIAVAGGGIRLFDTTTGEEVIPGAQVRP